MHPESGCGGHHRADYDNIQGAGMRAQAREANFMGRLSIGWKLGLLAGFGLLALVVLSGLLLWVQYQNSYDARKASIQQAVEVAQSIVQSAHQREQAGELTREQAQALAIRMVNDARYAGNEYFWINDLPVRLVTHPF